MNTVVVSAIVGILTSAVTAYITTRLRMREERAKWDRDFALKYAQARSENRGAADNLASQFAVGFLLVEHPNGCRDRVFIPEGGRITIGRDSSRCQVVLLDPSVSAIAVMIETEGSLVFVQDLYTRNGTFLNGTRLQTESRSKLKSGDVIKLGDTKLTFQAMPES
jgi:pSer/pThr/pTyr-binding forkhead associated (FHA) protein